MKDLEIQKFIILQDIYNEQASLNRYISGDEIKNIFQKVELIELEAILILLAKDNLLEVFYMDEGEYIKSDVNNLSEENIFSLYFSVNSKGKNKLWDCNKDIKNEKDKDAQIIELRENLENTEEQLNSKKNIEESGIKILKERNDLEEELISIRENNENLQNLVGDLSYNDINKFYKDSSENNKWISFSFLGLFVFLIIAVLWFYSSKEIYLQDEWNKFLYIKILIISILSLLFYEYKNFENKYNIFKYRSILIQCVNIVGSNEKYKNFKNSFEDNLSKVLFNENVFNSENNKKKITSETISILLEKIINNKK